MQIYERVFDILQKKGMTQKEFSEKTGIPQSTISDWKGKHVNPAADKIMIICKVLEISPYDILSGTENSKYENVDYLVINKSSEEYEIIEKIRNLPRDERNKVRGYIDALLGNKKKK